MKQNGTWDSTCSTHAEDKKCRTI